MRNHELNLPHHGSSRDRITAIQEIFLKLNSQDEAGIIATYQSADSLISSSRTPEERLHLYKVKDATKARMLALVSSSTDEAERRRLTDTFSAVLGEWWFAKELWGRWESERRARTRAQFWGRIFSFFKRRARADKK